MAGFGRYQATHNPDAFGLRGVTMFPGAFADHFMVEFWLNDVGNVNRIVIDEKRLVVLEIEQPVPLEWRSIDEGTRVACVGGEKPIPVRLYANHTETDGQKVDLALISAGNVVELLWHLRRTGWSLVSSTRAALKNKWQAGVSIGTEGLL